MVLVLLSNLEGLSELFDQRKYSGIKRFNSLALWYSWYTNMFQKMNKGML